MSANKLMGKRSLVLAATLVLVVSMGLPVIAHGAMSAPHASTAASVSHTGVGAAASVTKQAVVAPRSSISPHPGFLVIHEVAPGGATTEDPAASYDTVSFEPILNTYETLVAYNGTTTASYVPVASTCVPGTAGCVMDYGSSLIANGTGPFAGQPIYWTFPIDPNATFYDPNTTASWKVTPTDVAFSLARTLSYSDLPFVASQNGWIAAQTLLPFGNSTYDFNGTAGQGIHFPFNNTPFNVMSSMLVNNSTYCPAAALASAGCITFVADGGGVDWPFFLQIVADALGAAITPCGVFTHNGAGLPGFVAPLDSHGDGACLLPGGAHSTDDAAFQTWLSGISDTAWDSQQLAALNAPDIEAYPEHYLVGSGPYSAAVSLSSGYTLRANPAYKQPDGCSGAMAYTYTGYCDPAVGAYMHQVNVTFDPSDANSISGFSAGTIDAGGIFPSHTVTNLLPLVHAGKVQYSIAHSLSNFFFGYDNLWNSTVFSSDFPSQPLPNIPGDFFNQLSARQFFTQSYPFLNVQNQLLSVGGIQYAFDTACGPIPLGMGDYYPTNLTCPGGNPNPSPSSTGSAGWWWDQGTNASSPYYDPELAACKVHQCSIPIVGEVGAQTLNAALQQWINEIYSLSGHAIKPYEFDLTFHQLIVEVLFSAPGESPVPIWNLGWAPDYPDPTDYMAPYAIPEGSYTIPDAVDMGYHLTESPANATACTHSTGSLADMYYWAYNVATAQILTKCEGYAWDAAQAGISAAAPLQDSPTRVLYYNAAEQILTKLSLYVWFEQANTIPEVAPWIDLNSVNVNPTLGGGGDQPFFHWSYAPPNTITFVEKKLPIGAAWSVTLGSQFNNTTSAVGSQSSGTIIIHVPNGSQVYSINAPAGWGVAKITGAGNPDINGGNVTGGIAVTWTVTFGQLQPVQFFENTSLPGKFLYHGALWSVTLVPSTAHGGPAGTFASTTGTSLTLFLPGGAHYKFTVGAPGIYKPAPGLTPAGLGVPATHGLAKLIKFLLLTVVVHFHETGITGSPVWNVTLLSATGAASAWFSVTYPHGLLLSASGSSTITTKLPTGTYSWEAQAATHTTQFGNTTVTFPSPAVTVPVAF